MDLKFQNVWGMDNSTWIHANRATEARSDVPILEIGILDEGLLAHLAARTGSAMFDWVIDEHILEGYLDEQHKSLIIAMNELVSDPTRVIHMIQPTPLGQEGDPSMNWKTIDEWAATYEHNRWIAPGRDEVR